MRAGGQIGEDVAAGVVGERGAAEGGDLDARALEEVAGGDVGDGAGERRGGGAERREGEKERRRVGVFMAGSGSVARCRSRATALTAAASA
jgi:hypothetical protein